MKNPSEIEILGDGKQSKEYLHVKDCVEGILIGYRKASGKVTYLTLVLEEQTIVEEVADLVMEEMHLDKTKVKRSTLVDLEVGLVTILCCAFH